MMNIINQLVAWFNNTYASLSYDEMVFIEMCKLN